MATRTIEIEVKEENVFLLVEHVGMTYEWWMSHIKWMRKDERRSSVITVTKTIEPSLFDRLMDRIKNRKGRDARASEGTSTEGP